MSDDNIPLEQILEQTSNSSINLSNMSFANDMTKMLEQQKMIEKSVKAKQFQYHELVRSPDRGGEAKKKEKEQLKAIESKANHGGMGPSPFGGKIKSKADKVPTKSTNPNQDLKINSNRKR